MITPHQSKLGTGQAWKQLILFLVPCFLFLGATTIPAYASNHRTPPCCIIGGECRENYTAGEAGCTAGGNSWDPACTAAACNAPQAPAPTASPASSTSPGGSVSLPNPLGTSPEAGDVKLIIARVIQGITGIAGSVALLMFVYGGFQWLTSQGNPEKIKKGRDILVWSALGLLVMFGSYLILRYILTAITTGVAMP